jgi:hypothetical protein
MILSIALAAALLPAPTGDKTYQNDSIQNGSQADVQAGFVKNEIAASVFTVPAGDGTVFLQNARVLFFNALAMNTTRKMRILVYPSGAVNPGNPIYTSPIFTFLPGGENLVDLSIANLEMAPGQTFTIGARFEEEGLFVNFSSVVTDKNGIQPNKNRIFDVSTNSWKTAESVGISGDFGIRCVVTPNGPVHYGAGTAGSAGVPTVDTFGAWKIGNTSFGFQGSLGAPSSTAFLGVSAFPASIPILGITLLADPVTMIPFTSPTGPGGAWTLGVSIPNDPLLVGSHFYAQVFFVDGGAPQGLSASDGLDFLLESP